MRVQIRNAYKTDIAHGIVDGMVFDAHKVTDDLCYVKHGNIKNYPLGFDQIDIIKPEKKKQLRKLESPKHLDLQHLESIKKRP